MKPNNDFLNLPKNFWACVRLVSQEAGYTERGTGQIKIPSAVDIKTKLAKFNIDFNHLRAQRTGPRIFGVLLQDYFTYRAEVLNSYVKPKLMNATKAEKVFKEHLEKLQPSFPIPMNKQKGEMKAPAYLTGLTNMLIGASI